MEDREAPVEHPQRLGQPDIKAQINGNRRTPSGSTSSPKQPPRKRIRYLEPPIWAQSVIGRSKSILGVAKVNNKANGAQPVTIPIQAAPPPAKVDINGHNQGPPMAGQVEDPSRILGPWEKSITGKKPFEDMTKIVADWLYVNVVSRNDLGELASHGVDVEIEAKIGQLIDKDTSQRYTLPVLSECILRENPRIGFKSSMTETQHRSLNDFLNQHVAQAHPQNPQNPGAQRRVPIDYLHRRETDKFFELPPSHHASLPPAVRERLNARHPVKVRVTYAQDPKEPKAILAKIIKARIADIDIYNPQSPLDCRISINFEMRYDGDVEELKAMSIDNRIPDRNKDRLSYKQSHYQVDLTQVTQITSANGVNRMDKEHELEIEISTAAIKEQGRRAAAGEANEYVSLVEGFLDNMRVLARAVPPT
ncbi:hypothetical protein OIDMADRAFT_120969 [Oidiodendron maius Zn]|uniref:mRNA-capping enzyme subunit beta n=1 Tax=Oidiodendron maius (strain Zn) TaxID=913774 RepID=A0A0C3HIT5_OIDMZ|nr:hypothetical protein OIDMADRAFT_120969 [Oidiodendron maius Zn]